MIKADNLKKRFGNIVALDDVSFEVNKGETFGLLGPNGNRSLPSWGPTEPAKPPRLTYSVDSPGLTRAQYRSMAEPTLLCLRYAYLWVLSRKPWRYMRNFRPRKICIFSAGYMD